VCIVTGAASGIGKAIAELLQSKGASVFMLDVNWSVLAASAQELNAAAAVASASSFVQAIRKCTE
jgi:NADP-dependent 3-hydroxy acid dehydrogenase YdfG